MSELKRELEQTRDRNESSLQEMKKEVESTLEVSLRLTTNVVHCVFHSLYACSIGIYGSCPTMYAYSHATNIYTCSPGLHMYIYLPLVSSLYASSIGMVAIV